MKEIPLTQGKVALVDDADFNLLDQHKWTASPRKQTVYAKSDQRVTRGCACVYMHVFLMKPGAERAVDHINGNGLDNRRGNLRVCTKSQNQGNRRKGLFRNGTECSSKYKGVYWNKRDRRWRAQIRQKSKCIYLGNFRNEHDAAMAYDAKARELFGEFARTNFPLQQKGL